MVTGLKSNVFTKKRVYCTAIHVYSIMQHAIGTLDGEKNPSVWIETWNLARSMNRERIIIINYNYVFEKNQQQLLVKILRILEKMANLIRFH